MGMAAAASLTMKIIAKYSPKYIIMAGIAGGVKDGIKNYGDVLVARWSFNYESGKYKYNMEKNQSIFEPDPKQIEFSSEFIAKINRLKSNNIILTKIKKEFIETVDNKKPNAEIKVLPGPVASGSAVIADKRKVENVRAGNRKLIGIDMETFGVMYAAKNFSLELQTKAISIKSISDFADQRKNDKYRNYAAYTSVQFIYYLILEELQNS
jgi:nucleoside phosphorylase